MTISSIRIEGGLLGPDILDQLLAGDLPGQRPADFGLEGKRNLTDEIAAAFADARALWGVFQHRLQRLSEEDIATSVTRDAWAIPFLGLLGYEPRYNPRAYDVDGLTFAISHRAGEARGHPARAYRGSAAGTRPCSRVGPATYGTALLGAGIPQPHRARVGDRDQRPDASLAPRLDLRPPPGLRRVRSAGHPR